MNRDTRWPHLLMLLCGVALIGFFFGMTEIQIEGGNGWACALPTWRIESHPLLDIFWGGRPMTGYHAWVFSFMLLLFHFPLLLFWRFTWRLEARCMGSLMLFWVIEDFVWFMMNPCYGISKFEPSFIPWHKQWLLGMPTDYLTFGLAGLLLIWWSFRGKQHSTAG
ncbi:MAG: hypothetical protein OEL57_11985 [Trichlorobacter sp.]|uniref:hypothetical protein n=1 Tax=Trichlorobacter sp. TaxID=2911007 RepID=UPI00256E3BAA|nr:hypothetical protein [Trichlorobacter sp.]MDK9718606.1 hypothetical protein [Trichlorobacter sp.]